MMKFILFLVITVAAFSCFQGYADQVVSSSGEESKEHRSTMPQASYVIPQVVKEWRAHGKKFFLVDVREPSEYKAGHLSGAINVSYLDVEGAAKGFDHQVPYIFYCTLSAWRAPYAANSMTDLGFSNAYILQGGIKAWKEGGQVIYADNVNMNPKTAAYPEGLAKVLYHPPDRRYKKKINITRKELENFNGLDGHPAYVVVNGLIYDLTKSRLWRGGVHGYKYLKDFPIVSWLVN